MLCLTKSGCFIPPYLPDLKLVLVVTCQFMIGWKSDDWLKIWLIEIKQNQPNVVYPSSSRHFGPLGVETDNLNLVRANLNPRKATWCQRCHHRRTSRLIRFPPAGNHHGGMRSHKEHTLKKLYDTHKYRCQGSHALTTVKPPWALEHHNFKIATGSVTGATTTKARGVVEKPHTAMPTTKSAPMQDGLDERWRSPCHDCWHPPTTTSGIGLKDALERRKSQHQFRR